MFSINPLIRWVGIGVLSVAGLTTSLRAINSVAEAMPSQTATFTLPALKVDLFLPSVFHTHQATTSQQATYPPKPQKANPSSPIPAKHKTSLLSSVAIPVAESPYIRVRVASHPTQLAIAISTQGGIALPNGKLVGNLADAQPYPVSVSSDGLVIGDRVFPNGALLLPGTNGFVWIDGHCYRGRVRLVWAEGQLNAINEVDLEHYLYGVVGAEMPPDWQPEALKAQAIAARSYALALVVQPTSLNWDIGNDEAYQCYRGMETETNTTIAAVEATRGTVLVKDGQIFLSQYASTDAISQSAHGGIGKSMSQTGAQILAKQGATALQILGYYYPGSAVGILQTSGVAS
jgi:hypothetical protein